MILTKLQEALAEIPPQRKALDEVESELRCMISRLSGGTTSVLAPTASSIFGQPNSASASERSHIEEVAELLEAIGKPTHITALCSRLSETRGVEVLRTKIEPGLNRHIAKTKKPKIAKFGPSVYGLPEWKLQQGELASIA